jgi:hypothetical protein
MVSDTELETDVVAIVKVAEVAPVGTVTIAGTVSTALLDDRLTTEPPVGAADESVTVPVDDDPPNTTLGDTARPARIAGWIVSTAV